MLACLVSRDTTHPRPTPSFKERDVVGEIAPTQTEAAGEAPLADNEAQRQHEESTYASHDVGDGHQGRLVCLRYVVATVLQV